MRRNSVTLALDLFSRVIPHRACAPIPGKCVFIVEFNSQAEGTCDEIAGMNPKSLPPKQMMPTTQHLGARLRHHREEAKKKLEDVAEAADLSPVGLHNLETAKASSKSDSYERVAEAVGVSYPVVVMEAYLEANKGDQQFIVEFARVFGLFLLEWSAQQTACRSSDEASPTQPSPISPADHGPGASGRRGAGAN